jgi:membrane protease YdiL (CAAX protease family)
MGAGARFFLNEDGRLRYFWRAAIFFVLVTFALPLVTQPAAEWAINRFHLKLDLNAEVTAFAEGMNLVFALLATAIFAVFERRGLGAYGLPLRRAFGADTWEGFLAGIVMAGAVAAGMVWLGGMQIHGFALTGEALALSALAWLGANVLVGLAEELWFRGYFLQSLWKSIGFWPAALVIAAIFAAMHLSKDGENVWDMITLVSISMMLCFSVKRTGALWFAIGFHIAFDFMQFFVIGSPNGNLIPQGRMLNVTFDDRDWLTGGVLGTEASWLMYPMIALVWLYIALRFEPAKEVAGAAADAT